LGDRTLANQSEGTRARAPEAPLLSAPEVVFGVDDNEDNVYGSLFYRVSHKVAHPAHHSGERERKRDRDRLKYLNREELAKLSNITWISNNGV
jgi:hypothetical protein